MPAEIPYAEILDSATATSPEALSSLSADISLPQSTASSSASGNEKPRSFSPGSVPHNLRPTTLNATKDMYWFAHMGEASQGNGSEGEGSPVYNDPPPDGVAVKTSPGGKGVTSPGQSESKEEAQASAQRDHEMRLRHYKEMQEEERMRKLTELQYASQQAQRFREQQEEDRRRKIDELRSKDVERRIAVEERKRLIWEAEQERKEAILRRNLERDAKIEARRNAHRNTMSIAFGSSTPRDIDLPAGSGIAGSRGSTFGSMVALSTANQPSDYYKRRTPSADVLDKDADPMTRSLVIFPNNRGRRKTDLTPTIPWERENALRSASPGNIAGNRPQAKRAVSMSRLDILAQPRRRPSAANMEQGVPSPAAVNSTSMKAPCKSMLNLNKTLPAGAFAPGIGVGGVGRVKPGMLGSKGVGLSRSMMHISKTVPAVARLPRVPNPVPVAVPKAKPLPKPRPLADSSKSMSKSMCHLSSVAPIPPPRPTRASRLRATTVASAAATQRDGTSGQTGNHLAPSEGFHKDLHSPSRPRSSQSMASEQSVTSTVSMRSQSGPRRARPFSIAGSIIPINPEAGQVHHPLPPQRRSRTAERKTAVVPPTRPPRAKSVGPDVLVPISTPKATPAASRKPPLAPKPTPNAPKVEKELESQAADKEPSEKVDEQEKTTKDDDERPPSPSAPKVEPSEQVAGPPGQDQSQATPVKGEEPPVPAPRGPRISSEEEAKAALAEKRRLAREQAEREAELERQRQEELVRQEEERIRLEEEEQRRMEEEQLRLAEELRKQEEEKLQKAIEEQRKKEEEEKARKEEENKMRIEKEEQERKLKEEAERQRKELEEKLKQEEAARAERKKRVEQIMKRTRKNEESQKGDDLDKTADTEEAKDASAAQETSPAEMNNSSDTKQEVLPLTESSVDEDSEKVLKVNGMNNILDSETNGLSTVQNRFQGEITNTSNGVVGKAKSGLNSEDVSPQTNGYSSHDISLSETSPDDKIQPDVCPLLDFTMEGASNESQWHQEPPPPPTDFEQLIDLSLETTNQNELNRLNNADELNSNRVPNIPFIAFEENVTRKQESSVTDLLS